MKKCIIVGKFALKQNIMDGQTVKCKTIHKEIEKKYGKDNVSLIDTYNWKKEPFSLFLKCFKAVKNYENIIMLPAHNGVKIFGPILCFFNIFFKRKLHYVVIGSWLFDMIKNKKILSNILKNKFCNIFVETTKLKENLESIGFNNVKKLNNYKDISVLSSKDLTTYENKKVLNICSFSRVNEMKGIKDAIVALKEINKENIIIKYDIYGPIEEKFKEEFQKLTNENYNFVSYKGIIDSRDSVKYIKQYDLLIFPTKYKTEGIPGTLIDSYASGVPVLASKWENYSDVIENNTTGIIFDFNNFEDFKKKILYLYNNQKGLYEMKKNCLRKAKEFCYISALNVLFENL